MSQETIQKTFQVSSSVRVDLSNIRGSVDVRPSEGNLVEVTAIKHTDNGDADATEIELSQALDGSVKIATHFPDGWWLWLVGSQPCRVDYIVKVPQGSKLKLKGVENSVLVDGLEGEFSLATVSGDLTLQKLTGPTRVNTVSGDVSISGLSGAFDFVTVSGDLDVSEGRLTLIHAKTVSGNLAIQTSLSNGPYRFDSVSGDVRLQLPTETRCSAHLSSLNGDIFSEFPTSNTLRRHGKQAMDIQGGGVMITASSISGNLQLYADGSAPRIESVDRRSILERLERGEIKPEEALAQMQG
jgi:DUF4097 and DUF4098 domain-containing protein YvlB